MAKNKINIITLGCSKNLVDSENILTQLSANNIDVIHDGSVHNARNVIINTCGFINDAKEESIDTIMQFAYAKEKKIIDKLFVVGCLAERYKEALRKDIEEVDEFFGVNDLKDIIEKISGNFDKNLLNKRKIFTPSHYAFLKISEGCNRKCSFCSIPLIRGEHKSVSMEDLQKQAEFLAQNAVKELILISQDSSYYGYDLYKDYKLAELMQNLAKIKDFEWIRLHYAYPDNFPKEVIQVMKDNPVICKYLDIPFQHISDNVLKMMRRGHDKKKIYNLIEYFRKEIPDIALRTTLILGHPGETEKDFEELKKFVAEAKFDRLGVFTYSEEEGTYGAENYKDEIPEEVKNARAEQIMEIQQQVSFELNQNKLDKVFKVVIDREEGEFYVGRTEFDTPEVDNEVLISNEKELKKGEFYNVKINYADEFDIFGEIV